MGINILGIDFFLLCHNISALKESINQEQTIMALTPNFTGLKNDSNSTTSRSTSLAFDTDRSYGVPVPSAVVVSPASLLPSATRKTTPAFSSGGVKARAAKVALS
jgi:hypothetical protein